MHANDWGQTGILIENWGYNVKLTYFIVFPQKKAYFIVLLTVGIAQINGGNKVLIRDGGGNKEVLPLNDVHSEEPPTKPWSEPFLAGRSQQVW